MASILQEFGVYSLRFSLLPGFGCPCHPSLGDTLRSSATHVSRSMSVPLRSQPFDSEVPPENAGMIDRRDHAECVDDMPVLFDETR
jgi:hypothetical protein